MSQYKISQNFLTASKTIQRLINLTDITAGDRVLEIGAGKGHITRALAPRCGALTAYEIDGALSARLNDTVKAENLRIIRGDFLKAPLPKGEYKVFSNIPFSVTSPILGKLMNGPNPPVAAWLAMEKGAAIRYLGKAETRASLMLKTVFEGKIVHHFRREDFHPAPRTDVVMIHLKRKQTPDITFGQRRAFDHFITQVSRRGLGRVLTHRQVQAALRQAGLEPVRQSETMDYVQWLCLFRCSLLFGGK